jgi:hypothetical protein
VIKNGSRLRSQVCDTEVIVVRATEALNELRAGGVPMVAVSAEAVDGATLDPECAGGNLLGKRYIDRGGGEVLVTKAGIGTLSIGATAMTVKEVKPLPASD